jgi:hypothetical protein
LYRTWVIRHFVNQCPESDLFWVLCGTAEPESAQRGAVHSGPSRIVLSRGRDDRDNAFNGFVVIVGGSFVPLGTHARSSIAGGRRAVRVSGP